MESSVQVKVSGASAQKKEEIVAQIYGVYPLPSIIPLHERRGRGQKIIRTKIPRDRTLTNSKCAQRIIRRVLFERCLDVEEVLANMRLRR